MLSKIYLFLLLKSIRGSFCNLPSFFFYHLPEAATGGFLWKSCSLILRNIYRKTPMLESLLIKLLKVWSLTRSDLCNTICMILIRFMTTFIHLKSLHTNLKRQNSEEIELIWVFVFLEPWLSALILSPRSSAHISSVLGLQNIARTNSWIKHITYSRLYLFKIKTLHLFKIFKKLFRKAMLWCPKKWKGFSSQ